MLKELDKVPTAKKEPVTQALPSNEADVSEVGISIPKTQVVNEVQYIRPVDINDHIRGNKDAKVKIIEYSDFECPFCKKVHPTMKKIIEEYGPSGKAAWIYRHFPIDRHKNARQEARASECAAEIGGHEAFWKYADRLFELTKSSDGLDLSLLAVIAEETGLFVPAFQECLDSDRYNRRISQDYVDGMLAGAKGTPHFVFLTEGQEPYSLSGAQPYEVFRDLIELSLQKEK